MALVAILRHDRHHPALAPRLEDEAFDLVLAGSIAPLLAVFGAQIETFEVAEAVIADAGDLAGRRITMVVVVMALPMPRLGYRAAVPAFAGIAAERRRDRAGIARNRRFRGLPDRRGRLGRPYTDLVAGRDLY